MAHPKFKKMIVIASRATNGVQIPGQKATRAEIIRLFKNHLMRLKTLLNVSFKALSDVCLRVNLTVLINPEPCCSWVDQYG